MALQHTAPFRVPIARPHTIPPPEANPWWWHPNRCGVTFAPDSFLQRLRELGEELSITWNPLSQRWQVWARAPRIQHPICQGWKLLFVHHDRHGNYLPLDERLFARLYDASAAKHGDAKRYMQRIQDEWERDKAKREAQFTQDTLDITLPYYDYSQIKVSGCGPSNGSKFATYLQ